MSRSVLAALSVFESAVWSVSVTSDERSRRLCSRWTLHSALPALRCVFKHFSLYTVPLLVLRGRSASSAELLAAHFLAAPSVLGLRSLERGCRARQGASTDVAGFLRLVRVLSQRPSASHQQGWTGPPQGEAVMDELAQSHYMQLCFGRNFLRHAALHHWCDPTADVS